jgi:hypothetical protein
LASPDSCQSTPPSLPLAEKSPSSHVASPAGGQSTLPSPPLAEKILSPSLEKTVVPSSPPAGCCEVPPSTVSVRKCRGSLFGSNFPTFPCAAGHLLVFQR